MTVGVAILGAGIFAKTAHLPGIAALPSGLVSIKAIYSRSESSARDLAITTREKLSLSALPPVYHDGEGGVDAVLARDDVQAVILILPITKQPELVLRALAAGKHVLSEKPVAADVRGARALIDTYEKEYKSKGLIWRVAENYETEPGFRKAGEELKNGRIGRVTFFEAITMNYQHKDNQYYKTPWRTVPDYQGGFLLDGGVHPSAALRMILPSPMTHLSGFATLNKDFLAPKDTLQAIVRTADGGTGTFTLSFASPGPKHGTRNGYFITGTKGSLAITAASPVLRLVFRDVEGVEEVLEVKMEGVEEELRSFFGRIEGAPENGTQDPRSALEDLAFIEAGLESNGQLVDLEAMVGKC